MNMFIYIFEIKEVRIGGLISVRGRGRSEALASDPGQLISPPGSGPRQGAAVEASFSIS
jgi:hypothetical protein